ncbi:putative cullin [Helianthus annuus]|uniref:Cullin n=1 Tax=Helianthus annuus TaxID=4232 RepID=A0A9K3NEF0_HELAN|nr:putative cullin [Helianthus annuus]KAJ0540011.1 putative cullin [Helianthus annuus]KAJ0548390.1 putative cullin [Helianthus annuus]KAJ0554749.1 putative cullin [Helianthus annuus]KAJ0720315.1 putative cullin [Helianthus annuus]
MMFEIRLSCYPICDGFVELRCLIMFFRCCIGCLCFEKLQLYISGCLILLDKVIILFCYLQEKDIFETYYRQHLGKRLLSNKSVSDEVERSLILKLKTECRYQFTSRFECMFTDMKTSEDTMKQLYEAMGPELGDGPTLVVSVLTTGSWPIKSTATCKLSSEIQTVYDEFTTYYLGTYSGRKPTWQTNMGSIDIKATFGTGQEHELHVSTYQMCVLMLFNSVDRLSYREIEQATEIPILNLKQCFAVLSLH